MFGYMSFPKELRSKLCSTNPIERLNGEIKRRIEDVCIFPNDKASSGSLAHCCWSRMTNGSPARSIHDAGNNCPAGPSRTDRAGVRADLDAAFALFPRLRERRAQKAGYLSGGEQQMVAIARGFMARPVLMLVDEPTMGL